MVYIRKKIKKIKKWGSPHFSQLPAPYFFLKHFYKFIYLYFYDMFIFIKTFYMFGKNIKLKKFCGKKFHTSKWESTMMWSGFMPLSMNYLSQC
jgi:predicted CDP-diglyceride synthetase/phosphatidate cytidylyltransferase